MTDHMDTPLHDPTADKGIYRADRDAKPARVSFIVPGEPRGKQRPRHMKNGHTYTPKETVVYENLIKTEYERQCGGQRFPDDAALTMIVVAYYTIPASAGNRRNRFNLIRRWCYVMSVKEDAYNDWTQGMKYADIATKHGTSLSAVKSWAAREWKRGKNKKVATKNKKVAKKVATSQPKKRGAPFGSKNASGSHAGAPKGNKNNFRHGAFEDVYFDSLTPDERSLIQAMEFGDEENLLILQIKSLMSLEIRLLRRIKEQEEKQGGLALDSVTKRELEINGNIAKGNHQKQSETTTRTISTAEAIDKLEQKLLRVQWQKERCIEDLRKIRSERRKMEEVKKGNIIAEEWIAAVTGDGIDE